MSVNLLPLLANQLPVAFEYGKGAWLYDTEGNEYLDSLAGIAVCSLGYAHPAVTKAICEQAGKVLHTSNYFRIPAQQALAKKLAELSGMEQVYFSNSGAEANETAIKLTRMFARKKNITEPTIIVMDKAFHGRTMATVSASHERIYSGFEPLVANFIRVPVNDITALKNVANSHKNVIAIMLEPVLGEGGIHVISADYIKTARALCDQHDWLLIIDEVQTGIARTGQWFAFQHTNVQPDILTLAKALGNGVPISACLARGKANDLFPMGKHGSTLGGNPLACSAALAVVNTIEKENIIQHATDIGNYLQNALKKALQDIKAVQEIRGMGLMIGVQLDRPAKDLMKIGLKHRVILNVTSDTVIRLVPPLIINQDEADQIALRLQVSLEEFLDS